MGLTDDHEVWARPPYMLLWHRKPEWVPIANITTGHLVATLDGEGKFSWQYPTGRYAHECQNIQNTVAVSLNGVCMLNVVASVGHLHRVVGSSGKFMGRMHTPHSEYISALSCEPELLGTPDQPVDLVAPWYVVDCGVVEHLHPKKVYNIDIHQRNFLTKLAGTDMAHWACSSDWHVVGPTCWW